MVEALGAGARLVRAGEFALDEARAAEKLARYQLVEPRRYVLEFVKAATLLGARRIEFRVSTAEIELRFDGDLISPEKFTDLASAAFGRRATAKEQALRHLAIGRSAAQGLGLRDFSYGIVEREGGPIMGIVIRERVRPAHLVSLATRLVTQRGREERILRKFCAHAPLAVIVNGERISSGYGLSAPAAAPIATSHERFLEAAAALPLFRVANPRVLGSEEDRPVSIADLRWQNPTTGGSRLYITRRMSPGVELADRSRALYYHEVGGAVGPASLPFAQEVFDATNLLEAGALIVANRRKWRPWTGKELAGTLGHRVRRCAGVEVTVGLVDHLVEQRATAICFIGTQETLFATGQWTGSDSEDSLRGLDLRGLVIRLRGELEANEQGSGPEPNEAYRKAVEAACELIVEVVLVYRGWESFEAQKRFVRACLARQTGEALSELFSWPGASQPLAEGIRRGLMRVMAARFEGGDEDFVVPHRESISRLIAEMLSGFERTETGEIQELGADHQRLLDGARNLATLLVDAAFGATGQAADPGARSYLHESYLHEMMEAETSEALWKGAGWNGVGELEAYGKLPVYEVSNDGVGEEEGRDRGLASIASLRFEAGPEHRSRLYITAEKFPLVALRDGGKVLRFEPDHGERGVMFLAFAQHVFDATDLLEKGSRTDVVARVGEESRKEEREEMLQRRLFGQFFGAHWATGGATLRWSEEKELLLCRIEDGDIILNRKNIAVIEALADPEDPIAVAFVATGILNRRGEEGGEVRRRWIAHIIGAHHEQ